MADSAFYVVYIERLESVSYDALKEKMNLCRSWYRLNEKMWIVYSKSDVDKLYRRFTSLVKDDGSLFICKLDIETRQGWMNKRFWSWLRAHTPDPES
jgi:hypothetical protein